MFFCVVMLPPAPCFCTCLCKGFISKKHSGEVKKFLSRTCCELLSHVVERKELEDLFLQGPDNL